MTDGPALRVELAGGTLRLRMDRPGSGNTLTEGLLDDLHVALDRAESDPGCKVVVLEGAGGVFSTGMDLDDYAAAGSGSGVDRFPELLRRFATTDRVVIAAVDGKAMAGGVGLAAASDLVYVTERATFTLSEALWGLLPCVIAPYLVRRIGFQKAYELTLTARTLPAREAAELRLADHLVDDLDAQVTIQARRLQRLAPSTVGDLKAYFRKLSILTEEVERTARDELARLLVDPRVRANVENYVKYGRLPWESW